jgi:NAD(P)-dependent dehydrogenase (short-subunit alcohol dehydrogenase family)
VTTLATTPARLQGRAALVTGASRGIGRATAVRLAAEGAALLLTAVEGDELDEVVAACRAARPGAAAEALPGDLADPELPAELIRRCVALHGSVDVLVNNAFWERTGAVGEIDLDGWERTLRVSLTAAMLLIRHALPHMLRRGGGAIVNVTSQRAFASGHGAAAYEAAKAGMLALTRSTAVDYGPRGVRCNCVSPGLILSERARAWLNGAAWRERAMRAAIPLARPGLPEEIAAAVAFLAGPDASYVNGAVLAVDGGALAGLPENAALRLAQEDALHAAGPSRDAGP